jgi:hypothetical protein
MAYYVEALRLALKGGEATLQGMLAHVDEEVERLVARDSPGLALVLRDYIFWPPPRGMRGHKPTSGPRERRCSMLLSHGIR